MISFLTNRPRSGSLGLPLLGLDYSDSSDLRDFDRQGRCPASLAACLLASLPILEKAAGDPVMAAAARWMAASAIAGLVADRLNIEASRCYCSRGKGTLAGSFPTSAEICGASPV